MPGHCAGTAADCRSAEWDLLRADCPLDLPAGMLLSIAEWCTAPQHQFINACSFQLQGCMTDDVRELHHNGCIKGDTAVHREEKIREAETNMGKV